MDIEFLESVVFQNWKYLFLSCFQVIKDDVVGNEWRPKILSNHLASESITDGAFGECLPLAEYFQLLWRVIALERHGGINSLEVTIPLKKPLFSPMLIVSV